ncbi:toprim domain-containing protein [Arsenophonus nasoniae]|uniref:Toprim domain-containing protein n=1 Tax=Arsenophonus nasoniae TaxID=638 RepID=A0AA95GEJ1_9GAMM|nr:toprim domain-containing protein [Arsenophonus nasoniae]WGL95593.1 toprim domain-containing protein [Arsenophonus nasoniae]
MNFHVFADLIIPKLLHDFQFKQQNGYLRQGVCPNCKKRELFTSAEKPFVLRCGRENKCGAEFMVKSLYPEIFDNWSAHYPKTEHNPHAAADAYLQQARGLDIVPLKGLYTESSYHAKGLGAATVKFALPNGAYWERIIDQPDRFDRKANFFGRYKGVWWQLPQQDLVTASEIWLTESIFDAISLAQNGCMAVSLMSCHNYPEQSLQALRAALGDRKPPLLVWALDNGKAGENAILKYVARSQQAGWAATAARPAERGEQYDWNDLHLKGQLTHRDLIRYRYYGDLLLAKSASDKALLLFQHTERHEFDFEHDNRLYWFKLDVERHMKAVERIQSSDPHLSEAAARKKALQESGAVAEIANCYPTPLYFQKSEETDESWYYLNIDFPRSLPPVKSTFTAAQLTSASEFKKRLLHIAKGAVYTGNTQQLDKILKRSLPLIKEVKTQNYIGYNRVVNAYIFNQVAIQNGRAYSLNQEDYFSLDKLDIKTLASQPALRLNLNFEQFTTQWIDDLWLAFGVKGYVVLAFWLGSLFAEQIRAHLQTYPFLEIFGEPGTGKSTLLEFMWRLFGRENYEGFDPSKATAAGRARSFAQVSNLPVCLIESDRNQGNAKLRAFDWNELKNIYDSGLLRSVGRKGGSNDTEELIFRGAIVIAQNAPILTEDTAIPERLIHLSTDKNHHTAITKAAAIRLERYAIESLSGFIPKALIKAETIFKQACQRYEVIDQQLYADPAINHTRIARNHAQIIAFLEMLSHVIPITSQQIEETRAFIVQLARERVKAVQEDPDDINEFWAMFDYLDSEDIFGVNHASEIGIYAVNFNQLAQVASEKRQPFLDIVAMKKRLKMGKARKFIRTKSMRSRVNANYNASLPIGSTLKKPEVVECWIFERRTA